MNMQNTNPHYTADHNRYPLTEAARRLLEQEEQPAQHWICSGCGTAHGRILPEECKNCGATALEFQYSSPADEPLA